MGCVGTIIAQRDELGKSRYVVMLRYDGLPVGGNLQTVTDETVDARYFHPRALPDTLFWWHRQRILDAFGNAVGVVRLQDVAWPFGEVTDNQEIRTLLEQSGMPISDLFEQLCGQRGQGPENPEVCGK